MPRSRSTSTETQSLTLAWLAAAHSVSSHDDLQSADKSPVSMAVAALLLSISASVQGGPTGRAAVQLSRRASVLGLFVLPAAALASKDCFEDCTQNCARNAPSSLAYCKDTCRDYCAQPDRRDGLSGSVSSEAGEVGFASAYDYTNRFTNKLNSNVEYGTDRPPSIPGLEGSAIGRALSEAAGVNRAGRATRGAR